jgi:hypothetical protein
LTEVRVFQVIETNIAVRGKGTQESPLRRIKQYWTLDGELLAEHDPHVPCCNDQGHVVKNGKAECDRCAAPLDYIAELAGLKVEPL